MSFERKFSPKAQLFLPSICLSLLPPPSAPGELCPAGMTLAVWFWCLISLGDAVSRALGPVLSEKNDLSGAGSPGGLNPSRLLYVVLVEDMTQAGGCSSGFHGIGGDRRWWGCPTHGSRCLWPSVFSSEKWGGWRRRKCSHSLPSSIQNFLLTQPFLPVSGGVKTKWGPRPRSGGFP